jgi:hypothetical protein
MLHSVENDPRNLLQVEINTISSSMGSLAAQITQMFTHFDEFDGALNDRRPLEKVSNQHTPVPSAVITKSIPENRALEVIVDGIAYAHRHFISKLNASRQEVDTNDHRYVVAMIVQENECNISDQRNIEYGTIYDKAYIL